MLVATDMGGQATVLLSSISTGNVPAGIQSCTVPRMPLQCGIICTMHHVTCYCNGRPGDGLNKWRWLGTVAASVHTSLHVHFAKCTTLMQLGCFSVYTCRDPPSPRRRRAQRPRQLWLVHHPIPRGYWWWSRQSIDGSSPVKAAGPNVWQQPENGAAKALSTRQLQLSVQKHRDSNANVTCPHPSMSSSLVVPNRLRTPYWSASRCQGA